MLYQLKNLSTGAEIILSEVKDYLIGRKDCDIILDNDQSISRKHAFIRIKSDCVTLEDNNSKYHTFHNSVKLIPGVQINLKDKDKIKFGILNHVFCFEAFTCLVTTSGLSGNKKLALKDHIEYCGGKLIDKWMANCTHLVVEEITLTIKVLQALISGITIVTPDYWIAYRQSKEDGSALPDINNYNKPKVSEQLLRSDFQCVQNPLRKTLFANKVFVFYKADFKKQMQEVIKSCGGECIAWEEEQRSFSEMSTNLKEYLMIKTEEFNKSFDDIIKKFQEQNKRAIPLNEIALAIIHCSCESHCNPDFNKLEKIFGKATERFQNVDVLVKDTQSQDHNNKVALVKSEKIISASEDLVIFSKDRVGGVKRLNGDDEEATLKKQKVDEHQSIKKIPDMFKEIHRQDIKMEKAVQEQPETSHKRKAEEQLKSEPKKPSQNPFNLFKHGTSKKRTFQQDSSVENADEKSAKIPKSSVQDSEHQFKTVLSSNTTSTKKNVENIGYRVDIERNKENQEVTKENVSVMSGLNKSVLIGTWISKNTSVKSNVSKIEDPEVKRISEAFKDCVQIKILPVSPRHVRSYSRVDDSSISSTNGVKNFKRFKKILPLNPQINIIGRTELVKVCANSVGGMSVDELNSNSEDEMKEKPKSKFKTFTL